MILVEIKATDRVGYLHRVGNLEIINDKTGTHETGNYKIVWTDEERVIRIERNVLQHNRTEHILALIRKAIEAIEAIENEQ